MFRISRIMQSAHQKLCKNGQRALSRSCVRNAKENGSKSGADGLGKNVLELQNVKIKLSEDSDQGNLKHDKRNYSSWQQNLECTDKDYELKQLNKCDFPLSKGNKYNLMSCGKKPSLRLGHGSSRKKIVIRPSIPQRFVSMWEGRTNFDVWKDSYSRLDDKNYTISDKNKRVYQMTWEEGTYIKRKKNLCCGECEERPYIKRPRNNVAPKEEGEELSDLEKKCLKMEVVKNSETEGLHDRIRNLKECQKRTMSLCGANNKSKLSCQVQRSLIRKPCQKECTPYPSFTECRLQIPLNKKPPPRECGCLNRPSNCELLGSIKIKEKFDAPSMPHDGANSRPK